MIDLYTARPRASTPCIDPKRGGGAGVQPCAEEARRMVEMGQSLQPSSPMKGAA